MVPGSRFNAGFSRSYVLSSAGLLLFSLVMSFWAGSPELSTAIKSYGSASTAAESDAASPVAPKSSEASELSDSPKGLRNNFYAFSCPQLEAVIFQMVTVNLVRDRTLAAGLLRMAFHDCFVQGCDGSVLLISNFDGGPAERDAVPNIHSLRGFEVIDDIKSILEASCPNTVSCADIVVLTAREVVSQVGGPFYSLATGRRDSRNSSKSAAERQLPKPIFNISEMMASFRSRSLNDTDLVSLLGSHTLGLANCTFLMHRLYNFADGLPDSRLNINLFYDLAKACPRLVDPINSPRIPLDPNSSEVFDNSYYKNLLTGRGLLGVDQALMDDLDTQALVRTYAADEQQFFQDFARAMVKLSNLAVLTGTEGEVRKNCSMANRK